MTIDATFNDFIYFKNQFHENVHQKTFFTSNLTNYIIIYNSHIQVKITTIK